MTTNIKDRIEFTRRVEILNALDFEDRELEEFPTTAFGGFAPWRLGEFLRLARRHPEYHMLTCIEPSLHVNRFVSDGQTYYLGEGDADPGLIHDPYSKIDPLLLYVLNSTRTRDRA